MHSYWQQFAKRTSRCLAWFVSATALALSAASARAAVFSDGAYFNDEFDGTSLDTTKWTQGTPNQTHAFVEVGGGLVRIESRFQDLDAFIRSNPGQISYGAATEWATEVRFQIHPLSASVQADNQGLNSTTPEREAVLIGGLPVASDFYVTLREATDPNDPDTKFTLTWGAYNAPSSAVPISPATIDLNRQQFYTLVLHHRPDDEVDVYLDGTLVATRTAFNQPDDQAAQLLLGDISGATAAIMDIDYVRVGTPVVPEPMSAGLLVAIGIGATLRRRRR